MTNLEIIRKACIAANPEILELKFGCRVKYQDDLWYVAKLAENAILLVHTDGIRVTRFSDYKGAVKDYGLELIGRDIRLADVLLAIKDQVKYSNINKDWDGAAVHVMQNVWDLRRDDNLEHQSEPTIALIAELLRRDEGNRFKRN